MGLGNTVTVSIAVVPKQLVSVTVKVVVTIGLALTLAPVKEFKKNAGDQLYLFPPVTVKLVVAPLQIVILGLVVKGNINFDTKASNPAAVPKIVREEDRVDGEEVDPHTKTFPDNASTATPELVSVPVLAIIAVLR